MTLPHTQRAVHVDRPRRRAIAWLALAGALAWSVAGCDRSSTASKREARDGAATRGGPTAAASIAPPTSAPRELLPADQTYAVVSGVLSWDDPGLAAFAPRSRKDRELAGVLKRRGVPAGRVRLLLDAEATAAAILDAVAATAKKAPKGSTLLFYYAGHGVRGADGKPYFASRDMRSRAPAATGLSLERLAAAIADHFRGGRVVLMADCCYSGALKQVVELLAKRGVAGVSLTSADAANVSTTNWTFTQAVIDGLQGDVLCDENGDGEIVLAELATEVQAAMLYREGQRHGYHRASVGPEVVVARAEPARQLSGRLPADRRRYVEVQTPQGWQVARVRAVHDGVLTVRPFDYSESTDLRVAVAQTRAIEFRRYPVGAAIEVYWGGKVWPAKVERTDGEFHFISYPGWADYWNEWVTSRRIVDERSHPEPSPEADTVMVQWRGRWYPARVLRRKGSRYLIRYDGYDASWDEWVGPRRLRRR